MSGNPAKPGLLYSACVAVGRLYIRFMGGFRKSGIKLPEDAPYLAIGNHTSRIDYMYMACALWPHKVTFVVSAFYSQQKSLSWLLRSLGTIPRFQFQSDLASVRQMHSTVSKGGIVGLYPQGQISPGGNSTPMPPGAAKLIRLLRVPVVAVKLSGGFLCWPKWSKKARRGKVDVQVERILSAEESSLLPDEEIDARLEEALKFRDYEWNRTARRRFRLRDQSLGLENVLYACPVCLKEDTISAKRSQVRCRSCGTQAAVRDTGFLDPPDAFVFDNPASWIEWQKEREIENFRIPGTYIEDSFRLWDQTKSEMGYHNPRDGLARLDSSGLSFMPAEGQGEFFAPSKLALMACDLGEAFEIGEKGVTRRFVAQNGRRVMKWISCAEAVAKLGSLEPDGGK